MSSTAKNSVSTRPVAEDRRASLWPGQADAPTLVTDAPTRVMPLGLPRPVKIPKPQVQWTPAGYKIVPIHLAVGTGNLFEAVEERIPTLLGILLWPLALVPPLFLLAQSLLHRKYERLFWIENGFDPDSFSN